MFTCVLVHLVLSVFVCVLVCVCACVCVCLCVCDSCIVTHTDALLRTEMLRAEERRVRH